MFGLYRPYMNISDEELMRLVQNKEDSAFDELWNRYFLVVQNFFYRRTGGDTELTNDLTQDLFLKLWNIGWRYDIGCKFRPWMFTIAFNLLRNLYREIDYLEGYKEEIKSVVDESYDDNIELNIDRERLFELLDVELKKLSESESLLFDLRFTDELSIKEIAMVIGVPEGTVKSRLYTLIKKLQKKLQYYV